MAKGRRGDSPALQRQRTDPTLEVAPATPDDEHGDASEGRDGNATGSASIAP